MPTRNRSTRNVKGGQSNTPTFVAELIRYRCERIHLRSSESYRVLFWRKWFGLPFIRVHGASKNRSERNSIKSFGPSTTRDLLIHASRHWLSWRELRFVMPDLSRPVRSRA